LILFRLLKLFGLDLPARIEAIKLNVEQRVELATDHVKHVAQEAAAIAVLGALAAFTGALAAIVGLIALYRFTAETYGPFAGLGAVAAVLIIATAALATAAALKGRSLASSGARAPISPPRSALDADALARAATLDAARAYPEISPIESAALSPLPATSAGDLVEPMSFLLSKILRYPSLGHPMVDELLGGLRTSAQGATNETIGRAAEVVRHGSRTNLVVVLSGAALLGWLLARQSTSR
jgi:hypothetical protein